MSAGLFSFGCGILVAETIPEMGSYADEQHILSISSLSYPQYITFFVAMRLLAMGQFEILVQLLTPYLAQIFSPEDSGTRL